MKTGTLTYVGETESHDACIMQTPYGDAEDLLRKVRLVRDNPEFVKWVPNLDEQIADTDI